MNSIAHTPVMIQEALKYLNIRENLIYIDATFGLGGYTKEILKTNNCKVISLDRDPDVKKFSEDLEKNYENRFKFILGTFSSLKKNLYNQKIYQVTGGIVADLGMSNLQIEDGKRGFSIKNNGPLDMRMSKVGISAGDVINSFQEEELSNLFWKYGEEQKSKKIARYIINERKKYRISTTHDLANIIKKAKHNKKPNRIHPATKIFQALRIFVNNELDEIKKFIDQSTALLVPGSRLVLVTFHSLEDRIVKNSFKRLCYSQSNNRHLPANENKEVPKFKIVGKSFCIPSEEEIRKNPKSRSAKLRGIERIII